MIWSLHAARPEAELNLLETHVARAGRALACPFSSSAELYSAVIAERRAAGIYGPRRHRKRKLTLAACALAGLAITALLIL